MTNKLALLVSFVQSVTSLFTLLNSDYTVNLGTVQVTVHTEHRALFLTLQPPKTCRYYNMLYTGLGAL